MRKKRDSELCVGFHIQSLVKKTLRSAYKECEELLLLQWLVP